MIDRKGGEIYTIRSSWTQSIVHLLFPLVNFLLASLMSRTVVWMVNGVEPRHVTWGKARGDGQRSASYGLAKDPIIIFDRMVTH